MHLSFYIEIHPNAFATELIKMIVAKIGHKYSNHHVKNLLSAKCALSVHNFFFDLL